MTDFASATIAWWSLPVSGATDHHLAGWAAWHGRLMVLAWAVLLPLGVMAARFFKVMPGQAWPNRLDHKAWWHAHRALQYAGVAAMTVGAGLAWRQGGGATALAHWHGVLGWMLLAAGWLQVLSGWLRGSKGGPTDATMRGDHYDMTSRRRWFERLHKGLGYLALACAVLTLALGLRVADAPRWMWLAIGLWYAAWLLVFARLQHQGRCIDTYEAIWGVDPSHPGHRVPPIGWGIRRDPPPG